MKYGDFVAFYLDNVIDEERYREPKHGTHICRSTMKFEVKICDRLSKGKKRDSPARRVPFLLEGPQLICYRWLAPSFLGASSDLPGEVLGDRA